jgi:HK97 family phage portal protein
MSIFSKFRKPNIKNSKDDNVGGGFYFPFGYTPSGKSVTPSSSMTVSAVYACVRVLSETVAQLPLNVYENTGDGNKRIATDHPLYFILHNEPNNEMSSFDFRQALMTHLLIWGNAYAQVVRNGKGEVLSLTPLLPNKMTVTRDTASKKLIYTYQSDLDGSQVFSKKEILHIPGLGFDGIQGFSPIAIAKNAVGIALAADEYGSKFFSNNATPNGILESDKPVGEKGIENLKTSWNTQFGGSANSHKIAVLEDGVKFKQMALSNSDSQFLETRKFQIDEIARIFRVPPHMIGDLEKSSFSNIEQMSLEFVMYSCNVWINKWEQALHQQLLLSTDDKKRFFFKFNLDGLLRGDYAARMAGYSTAIQNGVLSIDEVREKEDLNKLPAGMGGNLHLINGNMQRLENAGKNYE